MSKFRFQLDNPLPRKIQIIILTLACLIPTFYVLKHYDSQSGFARLILFGKDKEYRTTPTTLALHPPMESPDGYDGQFYAQIAMDPLLTDPALKQALEVPAYRSRRILIPALAYVLGLGRPAAILQICSVMNLAFWFLLLFGMIRCLKAETARDYLCIFAAVFTTGSMISLQRSLTDLPATTLGFYGAALGTAAATGVITAALLARETSVFFLLRFAWPLPKNVREWLVLAARSLLIISPLALWMLYMHHLFGNVSENTHAFSWPFMGWAQYMQGSLYKFQHMTWQTTDMMGVRPLLSWSEALHRPGAAWTRFWGVVRAYGGNSTIQEYRTFELVAPLSLLVQICYFAIWRTLESPYWRMGVGFAFMVIFLTTSVVDEEIAFSRVVLPMTIAFNIGLVKMRGRAFTFNFIAGNIGFLWGLRDTLGYCLFR